MEEEKIEEKAAADMFLTSSQYCTFIEQIKSFEEPQIMEYLLKMCPLLYLKGNLLPNIEADEDAVYEQYVTEEQYELILLSIKSKIEQIDFFQYFDNQINEPITISFSEFLTDIYQDLKDFILLYAKGTHTAKKSAVLLCKTNFEQNWGLKLAILLSYLHKNAYPPIEESEEMYW